MGWGIACAQPVAFLLRIAFSEFKDRDRALSPFWVVVQFGFLWDGGHPPSGVDFEHDANR
jgi:hypothetical protein